MQLTLPPIPTHHESGPSSLRTFLKTVVAAAACGDATVLDQLGEWVARQALLGKTDAGVVAGVLADEVAAQACHGNLAVVERVFQVLPVLKERVRLAVGVRAPGCVRLAYARRFDEGCLKARLFEDAAEALVYDQSPALLADLAGAAQGTPEQAAGLFGVLARASWTDDDRLFSRWGFLLRSVNTPSGVASLREHLIGAGKDELLPQAMALLPAGAEADSGSDLVAAAKANNPTALRSALALAQKPESLREAFIEVVQHGNPDAGGGPVLQAWLATAPAARPLQAAFRHALKCQAGNCAVLLRAALGEAPLDPFLAEIGQCRDRVRFDLSAVSSAAAVKLVERFRGMSHRQVSWNFSPTWTALLGMKLPASRELGLALLDVMQWGPLWTRLCSREGPEVYAWLAKYFGTAGSGQLCHADLRAQLHGFEKSDDPHGKALRAFLDRFSPEVRTAAPPAA